MPERAPLPPGILPNVTDTDPPPLHEATIVLEAYVGVDETKLSKPELAEVKARHPAPNIYTPPPEAASQSREHSDAVARQEHHERHEPTRSGATTHTTVTVSRTTSR